MEPDHRDIHQVEAGLSARRSRAAALLIVLVAVLCYAGTLRHDFVWGSNELAIQPATTGPLCDALRLFLPAGWAAYAETTLEDYRPLATLTYWLDHRIGGSEPSAFHRTNLILFALSAVLVFAVARRVLGSVGMAAAAALLFAVHPIHMEAVNWLANRALLVGTLLALCSVHQFIRWVQTDSGRSYVASFMALVLSFFALELNVVVPAVLTAAALCLAPRGHRRRASVGTFAFWAAGVAFFMTRQALMGTTDARKEVSVLTFTPLMRVATALKSLAIYGRMLCMPTHLSADTAFQIPLSVSPENVGVAVGALGVALLLIWAWRAFRSDRRGEALGALWLMLMAAPVSNIIFLATRPIAEQRMYAPSVGLCILLCALAARVGKAGHRALVAVVVLWTAGLVQYHFSWGNDYALWVKTVREYPDRWRAHLNLGTQYQRRGLLTRAMRRYEESVELAPTPQGCNGLAWLCRSAGQHRRAVELLKQSLSLKPDVRVQCNLGQLYIEMFDYDKAEETFRQAIRIDPSFSGAHAGLAGVLRLQGKVTEACQTYRLAVAKDSRNLDARLNLGSLLLQCGLQWRSKGLAEVARDFFREAKEQFLEVLRHSPNHWDAHFKLGTIYAATGDMDLACDHFDRAKSINPSLRDEGNPYLRPTLQLPASRAEDS